MGLISMIKSYLIAAGVFIAAIFAALVIGRRKQYVSDNLKVEKAVKKELDKISDTAKKVNDNVSKLPDAGPDSAADQLRKDWDNG